MQKIEGLEFIEEISKAKSIFASLEILRGKVVESPEYRLLYGKTQMFYGDEGRSRGRHSENIGRTSSNIIKKTFKKVFYNKINENKELYIINEKIVQLYAEIAGLSHDLGHTPLGHDGENVLNKKLYKMSAENQNLRQEVLEERQELFSGITMQIDEQASQKIKGKYKIDIEPGTYKYEEYQQIKREQKGEKGIGFEHNEYGAQIFSRIFDELTEELEGTAYADGMKNIDKSKFLTAIIAHSRSRFPTIPEDYLAQVVRQSDKVEYMNYDFEEYEKMGCFPIEKNESNKAEHAKFSELLGKRAKEAGVSVQEIRDYMMLTGEERREDIEDKMIEEALNGNGKIHDNMKAMKMAKICAQFKDDTLFYIDENGKRGLITGNNVEREEIIISKLTEFYQNNPDRIPDTEVRTAISPLNKGEVPDIEVTSFSPSRISSNQYEQLKAYIASLTNERCEELYQELVQERIQEGKGHGITPVTQEDINKRLKYFKEESNKENSKLYSQEKSVITYSYLPQEIRERIDKNREKHVKQVDEDEKLYQSMLEADKGREEFEQDNDFNMETVLKNNSLIEYRPNRFLNFFSNLINKIKDSNFIQNIINRSNSNEKNTVDIVTKKIEENRKQFDDSLVVSKEEQAKNRMEYEASKSNIQSKSKETEREDEFQH